MTRNFLPTRSFLSFPTSPPPHLSHSFPSFPTPSLTLTHLKTLLLRCFHYFLISLLTLSFLTEHLSLSFLTKPTFPSFLPSPHFPTSPTFRLFPKFHSPLSCPTSPKNFKTHSSPLCLGLR